MIRKIKYYINLYKDWRNLKRGGFLLVYRVVSQDVASDSIHAIVWGVTVEDSVKYRMVLKADFKIGYNRDDFLKNLVTIRIKLQKK